MDGLDEFLERTGIELLPYQKEILRYVVNDEKLYIIFPPYNGRDETRYFLQGIAYLMSVLFPKRENVEGGIGQ